MSDTKPTAKEASSNPAEVVAQTESSAQAPVESKSDGKAAIADAAGDTATTEASAEVKPEQDVVGDSTEGKTESEVKSDKNGAEKKENGHSDKKRSYDRDDRRGDRYNKHDRGDRRKGSYGGDRYKKRSNKNNEFADLPETDDPTEIRSQVEFYFSVANLSTDRHMFLEVQGAKNRPVPIKHITSFKRMRRFQPYSAVVAALRDSQDLNVIDDGEFSGAGNEAIQRKEPLAVPKRDNDDEYKPTDEELYERMFRASQNKLDASIYVKGFGKEEDAGQIALESFFKPYGAVMVRKRRDEDENWKGSVFVEFDTEDSQQQFLALEPKPKWNDKTELLIMSKKEYSEKKCEEKGITPAWKLDANASNGRPREYRHRDHDGRRGDRGGRGRGRGRGGHDGRGRGGRDRRNNRDRSRSRSPRRSRRDRSDSRDSRDSRDWNGRRDKFQKSRDYDRRDKRENRSRDRSNKDHDKPRSGKKEDGDNSGIYAAKNIIKDADGVPVVQDSNPPKSTNKRKAEDNGEDSTPKKSKIEIKVDA